MKKQADPNTPKKDPIVDRPISTMRGRLLFGTLIIGSAAYLTSLIAPLKHSPYLNGSYVGLVLGIGIIGYLFFKYAHPLDQARWKHFRNGFYQGYLLIYLTFMLSMNHSESLQAFLQMFQQDFVIKMIYACAAIYGWVTGFYKMWNVDSDEKFKQVCKLGDMRAIKPLSDYIRNPNVKYRRKAAVELGKLGDVRVVPGLLRGLKDRDHKVCINSIKSLVKMDDIHAVKPLITTLQYGKPRVQREAAKALGGMYKTRAVDPLIETLKVSKKGFVRASIVEALGNLEDVRALEALSEAMHDRNWGVRLAAGEAIKKLTWLPEPTESKRKETPVASPSLVQNERQQSGQAQGELPSFLNQPASAVKQAEPSPIGQPVSTGLPVSVEVRAKRSRFSLPAFFKRLVCNQKQADIGKSSQAAAPGAHTKPQRRGVFAFLKRKSRASKRAAERLAEEPAIDEQVEPWELTQPVAAAQPAATPAWSEPVELSEIDDPARPPATPPWGGGWEGAQVAASSPALDTLEWSEDLEYEEPYAISEPDAAELQVEPNEVELSAYQETEDTCACTEPVEPVAFTPPSMHEF